MSTVSFNTGWLFGPASAGSDLPGFDDSALAAVTLPHTVARRIEALCAQWTPAVRQRFAEINAAGD